MGFITSNLGFRTGLIYLVSLFIIVINQFTYRYMIKSSINIQYFAYYIFALAAMYHLYKNMNIKRLLPIFILLFMLNSNLIIFLPFFVLLPLIYRKRETISKFFKIVATIFIIISLPICIRPVLKLAKHKQTK